MSSKFISLVDRATKSHAMDDYVEAINDFIKNLSSPSPLQKPLKNDFKLAHLCLERIECNIESSIAPIIHNENIIFSSEEEESSVPFFMSLVDEELGSISISSSSSTTIISPIPTTLTTPPIRQRSKSVQSHLAAVRRAHEEQALITNKQRTFSLLGKREKENPNAKLISFIDSIKETRRDLITNFQSIFSSFSSSNHPSIRIGDDKIIINLLEVKDDDPLYVILPPIFSSLKSGLLGQLGDDFMKRCLTLLREGINNPSLINQLFDEIVLAESHIHDILMDQFPKIPDSTLWRLSLRATIQEWIWNSPLLRGVIFLGSNARDPFSLISIENEWVGLLGLIFEDSLLPLKISHFDQNPTQIDNPFNDIICKFKSLPSLSTPLEKLQCIFLCLKDLCLSLKDLSLCKSGPSCDDIIQYMSYIILRSNVTFIEMEIFLLTKTIPPELLIGEYDFALAIFQSSLDFLKVKFNKYF